jgi:hypothetical protein
MCTFASGGQSHHQVAATAAAKEEFASERICAAVEERLFRLGYKNLRILTDMRNVHADEDVAVQVECEKRMMKYKGKVMARNASVLDVDLQPVVEMFP